MKIRTEEDVRKLNDKIISELGIDLENYRNEEVVANFISMLVFPEYVVSWIIRPIIMAVLLFGAGYFLPHLEKNELIFYSIIGLFLFFMTGLFGGIWLFMRRIKADLWSIIRYTLTLVTKVSEDSNQLTKGSNEQNQKEQMNLLYKGIIHIVTLPMLSTGIRERLPILGGAINSLIRRVLLFVSDRINFNELALEKKEQEQKINREENIYSKTVEKVSNRMKGTISLAFGIIGFPIKAAFVIFLIILLLFLYYIN